MPTPAAAFRLEFASRHRWVILGFPIYLLALALIKPFVIGRGPIGPGEGFAAFAVVPFTVVFFYLIAVFSFGTNGDVAGRASIYPARYFTLPIRTVELARWPMVYGAVAMMLLWIVASSVARPFLELQLPWIWPGFMAAVVLAWIQVFTWMPYGLRGLRVVAATAVLIGLDAVVFTAIELKWPELWLVAFLAPQLPLAYVAACWAVARARRGEVPDWSPFAKTRSAAQGRSGRPFRSAQHAQFWFEWRRHGWSLPAMVALVLPFQLLLLFISGYGSQSFVIKVLLFVLLTPIQMAAFAATTISKANPFAREVYGLAPFLATRPLTSAELIAAKLKMAALSTIVTWLLVLIVAPIGFAWSGADVVPVDWARWTLEHVGWPRFAVLLVLIFTALVGATWLMLVQTLYLVLTGRVGLIKAAGFIVLAALMGGAALLDWISSSVPAQRWLWDNWPSLLGVLVALKTAVAIWSVLRLHDRRLVSDRLLIGGAAAWTIAVLSLYAVVVWWFDTPMFPSYKLALVAILAVPLARLAAAPLALAANRHG